MSQLWPGKIIDRVVYLSGVVFILLIFLISLNTIRRSLAEDDPVVESKSDWTFNRGELTETFVKALLLRSFLEYDSIRMAEEESYIGRLIIEMHEWTARGRFEIVEPCSCSSGEERVIFSRAINPRRTSIYTQ